MPRKLGEIGDVNPIEYGGGFVFGGDPGSGGPWVEYVYGLDEVGTPESMLVYRADLHSDGKEFLSWYDWVDWDKIADSLGDYSGIDHYTASKLRTAQARAMATQDVAGYYGWSELDQYPLELSAAELAARWELDWEDFDEDED